MHYVTEMYHVFQTGPYMYHNEETFLFMKVKMVVVRVPLPLLFYFLCSPTPRSLTPPTPPSRQYTCKKCL